MKNANDVLLSLMFVVLLQSPVCLAATLTVDSDGGADFKTIQDAIDAAWDFDTIIVHPGLYEEHINYNATWVEITSTDPNDPAIVEATVIDGSGEGNVVMFRNAEGPYASLKGFTIQNGGTGIYCHGRDTSPIISRCRVVSNNAGILCDLSSPLISFSTIADNAQDGIKTSRGNILNCNIQDNGQYGTQNCRGDISHCTVGGNGEGGISYHHGNITDTLVYANLGHGIDYPYPLDDYHAPRRCIIPNCTIVGNKGHGMHLRINGETTVVISNTVVVSNAKFGVYRDWSGFVSVYYSNVWGNVSGSFGFSTGGLNNPRHFVRGQHVIEENPFFAKNGFWDQDSVWHEGEYHLRSTVGRWDVRLQDWVSDPIDSPCLDRGDPNSIYDNEPYPNGGRVNMGVYGNTVEASKSEGPSPYCVRYPEMDFNKDCKVDQLDYEIFMQHWLECGLDPDSTCDFVTEDAQ